MSKETTKPLENILMNACEVGWNDIWFVNDIFILIVGVVANTALLCLFLREKKSLSASQVLGLNVVAMDLIYLCILPVSLFYHTHEQGNHSDIAWQDSNITSPMTHARDIFSMFNLIGCPLLLACMCFERYLAVIRPVLYLRLRKWEYRVAVSAVVWCVTLSFCVAAGLADDIIAILTPLCIIISCLFLIMVACLGGVVWSLRQQSPAHTTNGNQARSESPLKRRAVGNVLVVVVPAVISYSPVLMMVPISLYVYYLNNSVNKVMCQIFEISVLFPRFGVLIGPLFYLSKARQLTCAKLRL